MGWAFQRVDRDPSGGVRRQSAIDLIVPDTRMMVAEAPELLTLIHHLVRN